MGQNEAKSHGASLEDLTATFTHSKQGDRAVSQGMEAEDRREAESEWNLEKRN